MKYDSKRFFSSLNDKVAFLWTCGHFCCCFCLFVSLNISHEEILPPYNSCTTWGLQSGEKKSSFSFYPIKLPLHISSYGLLQNHLATNPFFFCWCFWAAVCWLQRSMCMYTPLYSQNTVLLKQSDTYILHILTPLSVYKMFTLYILVHHLGGVSNTS